jgi:hypothetical protein
MFDLDKTIKDRHSTRKFLSVGYTDPDFPANHLHISRESVDKNITFLNN